MRTVKMSTALTLVCFLASVAAAAPPQLIGYQGRLLGPDGLPTSGVLTVVFTLFDGSDGNSALWSESQDVALADGFYTVQLGDTTPIPRDVLSGVGLWLELSVASEALSPRQELSSVPFARVSHDLVGGLVDATSIRIDGGEVINADGDFVGSMDRILSEVVAATQDSAGGISLDAATLGGLPAGHYLTRAEFEATDLENLLTNAGFERWPSGIDTYPEWWSLSGEEDIPPTGVSRTATSHDGTYAAAVRDSSTTRRFCVKQQVFAGGSLPESLRGEPLSFTVWVRKTEDSGTAVGEIVLSDGATSSTSALQDSDLWHRPVISHTISAAATELTIELCPTGDVAAQSAGYYFDSAMLTRGEFDPAFRPNLLDRFTDQSFLAFDDLAVPGDLSVAGFSSLAGHAAIGGDLTIAGDATFGGDLHLTGDGIIDGQVTFSDSVMIGNAELSEALVRGLTSVLVPQLTSPDNGSDTYLRSPLRWTGLVGPFLVEADESSIFDDSFTLETEANEAQLTDMTRGEGEQPTEGATYHWRVTATGYELELQSETGSFSIIPAPASCKEIRDNGQSTGDGSYWIDPDGATGEPGFEAYCDMTTDNGGWTLLFNLASQDGVVHHFDDNTFWLGEGVEGEAATALDTGFKSPAYAQFAGFDELMVRQHDAGSTIGFASYGMLSGYQDKSFLWLAQNLTHTTVTDARARSNGTIGDSSNACCGQGQYGDLFLNHGQALVINRSSGWNADHNHTRLATTLTGSDYPHTFAGLGGRHYEGASWGLLFETAPITSYCPNEIGYGSSAGIAGNYIAWSGHSSFSYKSSCAADSVTWFAVDTAVFVR